jgi:activator of HSP90 ATPase
MEKLEMEETFPANAESVYDAWLDSKTHSEFTGGKAVIKPKAGTRYSAWNEYITGEIKELEKGKRILQTWRADEFPQGAEDSMLEVKFEDTGKGCRLLLKHWNIPEGLKQQYKEGWEEYYFKPMKAYFGKNKG